MYIPECAVYLRQGVGLILVDVAADRVVSLRAELLARLHEIAPPR